jgi:hypothetical protein
MSQCEPACFKINESKQIVFELSSPKSSGIFGEFLPEPASLTNLQGFVSDAD